MVFIHVPHGVVSETPYSVIPVPDRVEDRLCAGMTTFYENIILDLSENVCKIKM